MCQLLGICANRPIDIQYSFREWKHRGKSNRHGYGFAYWGDGRWQLVKEASSLYEAGLDQTDEVLAARSHLFLAHVRYATVGAQDGSNTHPFVASLRERSLVFAHNGTVEGIHARSLRELEAGGTTDSEHAFLWLLESLEDVPDGDFARRLKALGDEVRSLGRFNFLLSDGSALWAYAHDRLHFIERRPPYGGELVRFKDDGYAIGLKDVKNPEERAVLIATEPLTDEPGWTRLNQGELLVGRGGRVERRIGG
jgi:predicted glutamine amidotransferase